MGGKNEMKVQEKADKAATEIKFANQTVRIHESGGYVHFHVDAEKLKVAVPAGIWFSAWEKISTQGIESWTYFDVETKTVLTIKTDRFRDLFKNQNEMTAEVFLKISKQEISDTFAALNKFTFG
jgi:hypothetical protein